MTQTNLEPTPTGSVTLDKSLMSSGCMKDESGICPRGRMCPYFLNAFTKCNTRSAVAVTVTPITYSYKPWGSEKRSHCSRSGSKPTASSTPFLPYNKTSANRREPAGAH